MAEGILDLFRDQFLKDVDAKAVVGELKQKGIVPQSCQEKVAKADGYRQRNEILHDCLKRTCTREALIKACDIIIELAEGGEENSPKMKKVGEDMKMKLGTGPGQAAANGGQSQVADAPFVASEFLEKYENEFFSDVHVKQSLQRLVRKGVISNVVKDRIENESDEQEAKETLFGHLSRRATTATLREWCEVAIAANGYPKMQELGRKMKAALP